MIRMFELVAGDINWRNKVAEGMNSGSKSEEIASYNSSTAKKSRLLSMLSALLDDPILSDVPKKPSLADVDTLLNLELGSAMKITIVKMDNTSFVLLSSSWVLDFSATWCRSVPLVPLGSSWSCLTLVILHSFIDVAVLNSATVKDLKLAIRKKINGIEQAQMGHRHISWRHIWASYCLTRHNDKLIDDNSLLSEHGIRNNSKVHFLPFIMSRVYQKHSRRRKHRFFHGLSKLA